MTTRYFALIIGIVYVLVGILGFFPGLIHPPEALDPNLVVETYYGRLLGIFPINILHNLVHLAVGVWGVAAYRSYDGSRNFARGLTVLSRHHGPDSGTQNHLWAHPDLWERCVASCCDGAHRRLLRLGCT